MVLSRKLREENLKRNKNLENKRHFQSTLLTEDSCGNSACGLLY
jgi:hypothetical protein